MVAGFGALRAPLLALLFVGASVIGVRGDAAQPAVAPASAAPAAPAAAEMTPSDLNAWLDGFMPNTLANADIVGAVVTVVRDGQIVANRGYGYADLASHRPVDPDQTLFRPGSISKLFTWSAVMQQVEQGHIDLDADVNQYIDFHIPAFNGAPITMRNIMTHTTGFEEVVHDLIQSENSATSLSLEEYVKQNLPRRIFAPGTMPAYSNYATALAGYIVQRVSGEPFAEYIQHHIFDPLHMQHATFVQPLPQAMRVNMSSGYKNRADGQAQPYEIIPASPAGALALTGADMALFMTAHLNQGAGLMRPETARLMHETIDHQFPGVNSMTLGFYQEDLNGQRILAHGGDTEYFHSNLALLMDQHIGVFISLNSGGGRTPGAALLRWQFMQGFMDRYFPVARVDSPSPSATAVAHGARAAGDYESSRRAQTSPMAAVYFLSQTSVSMLPNGDLVGPGLPQANGRPVHWREVQPWIWRDVNGADRMGARVDGAGRVTALAAEPLSFAIEYTRAPWFRAKSWLLPALGAALGALTLTFLSWPIRAIVRRVHRVSFPYEGPRAQAHRIGGAASLLVLAYVGAWLAFVATLIGSLTSSTGNAMQPWFMVLYVAGVIPIAAFLGVAYANFNLWRAPSTWFAKIWSLLLLASLFVVLWFAVVMNFLSFNFRY